MKWEIVNHLFGGADLKSAWSKIIKSDLPKPDTYPCWKISLLGIVNSQLFTYERLREVYRRMDFSLLTGALNMQKCILLVKTDG